MRTFIQIQDQGAWVNADHIISVWPTPARTRFEFAADRTASMKIIGYDSTQYSVLPYATVQKLLLNEMLNVVPDMALPAELRP